MAYAELTPQQRKEILRWKKELGLTPEFIAKEMRIPLELVNEVLIELWKPETVASSVATKIEAPPSVIEAGFRSGLMDAIGILLIKRATKWRDEAKRDLEWFKQGRMRLDAARTDIIQFTRAINEDRDIAEDLGLPYETLVFKIEQLMAEVQSIGAQITP